MITHLVGSPLRKFTSLAWPVKVLKRSPSSAELKPDWPPSPYISWYQTTDEPVYWNVPLSWVPPWRLFFGRLLLTDRLWNCSVETVSYTHLRAHETRHDLVCRLLLEKK